MSRLTRMIKRATRIEAAPMGFGVAVQGKATSTLLCLLRLDKDQAAKIGDAAAAADAVIVNGVDADKLKGVIKRLGDTPVGLRLDHATREAVAAAREAGADFVVLDHQSSAEAVLEEGIGIVLSVGHDAGDAAVRTLAGMPLDVLEVPAVAEPFTLGQLVELRRLSMLSQTPLLIETPADAGVSRLEALRDAGVVGVIVDGESAGELAALREAVTSLPPRGRRREDRAEAVLPSLIGVPSTEVEEDPEFE